VDRIIVVDETGAIPSTKSPDRKHVFVNLAQEYSTLQEELRSSTDGSVSQRHASNLKLLRDALKILPHSSSALITSPLEAANTTRPVDDGVSTVGTRRQKNPLIHNLLTDKPAYSASLPSGRLGFDMPSSPSATTSTFVKRGMPLAILPNPAAQAWTADSKPRLRLTDPSIDLDRLVYLIDDSFNRKLDVEAYLKRVNDRIAGVIIAGEYEGGAILTWETPPGVDDGDPSRLVPYLDKFAVLKRSQGAGGVADVVFNAMVRTCFPNGVCWRSRKDNPVNKWYFERSRGTFKIPGSNWTMFWTTPGLLASDESQTFLDYEGVCRTVKPTWADGKRIAD
jgi:amino-acid N-acetyltransferase